MPCRDYKNVRRANSMLDSVSKLAATGDGNVSFVRLKRVRARCGATARASHPPHPASHPSIQRGADAGY